jgi:hypothetical protein
MEVIRCVDGFFFHIHTLNLLAIPVKHSVKPCVYVRETPAPPCVLKGASSYSYEYKKKRVYIYIYIDTHMKSMHFSNVSCITQNTAKIGNQNTIHLASGRTFDTCAAPAFASCPTAFCVPPPITCARIRRRDLCPPRAPHSDSHRPSHATIRSTLATSRWNIYNIHLKQMKHLKHTVETPLQHVKTSRSTFETFRCNIQKKIYETLETYY